MKALIATSLGNIKVDNFDVPDKGNNILIRTELASICGSDIHMAFSGWGINNWPAEPKNFSRIILSNYEEAINLSKSILKNITKIIDRDQNYFDDKFE